MTDKSPHQNPDPADSEPDPPLPPVEPTPRRGAETRNEANEGV